MNATENQKPKVEGQGVSRVGLHRFVRPFERENTKLWRDRERIRTALEHIKSAADEASVCLEMDERLQERLPQASQALYDLEKAVRELEPPRTEQDREDDKFDEEMA
jgi:hypothetical protein